jgi:hypothetical protein
VTLRGWTYSSAPYLSPVSRPCWLATGLLATPPEQKVRPLYSDLIARFKGPHCLAGVDLSMTTDLSAVSYGLCNTLRQIMRGEEGL